MAESSTRTVDRALVLLRVVCDDGHVSLADAARSAALSASTALRLLRTLESQGFVRRAGDGNFTPGARIVQLGALALSHQSLISLASGAMSSMVEATGESCYLSIRGPGDTAIYIAIVEGTHSVRHASWVGRSLPLVGSAAGAVLADQVGDNGYVIESHGVEEDVTAVAVPVRAGKRTMAALSIVVPSYRVTEAGAERIGEALILAADSVVSDSVVSDSIDGHADGHRLEQKNVS